MAPTFDFPAPLVEAYQQGKLAVLFGSGLSMAGDVKGDFPRWKDLPERPIDQAVTHGVWQPQQADAMRAFFKSGYVSLEGMLTALDMIKQPLRGARKYRQALAALFRPKGAAPGDVHRALAGLDLEVILTTTYDQLFEKADPSRQVYHWLKSDKALGDVQGEQKVLFKIHGSAEDDDSIVMTRAEYEKAAADVPYQRTMSLLLQTYTFLLVGYGIDDPLDLDLLFGLNTEAFGSATQLHYALVKDAAPTDRDRWQREMNVQVVPYDDHEALPSILRELAKTRLDPAPVISTGGLPVPQAQFIVPFPRSQSFVGREDDLAKLHALLQKSDALGLTALTGMGGIGKTQLAVEYAYRHAPEYPGGVYWVNAARPWQAELAALAEKVGLKEDDAPDAAVRQQRLARAFAAHLRGRPGALVIFDNVANPLELRSASLDIVPAQLACRLLFTTRRRDMPFEKLDVGVLPDEDALHLLLSKRPEVSAKEQQAARTICRTLGCLPLALALAAAYLDKRPRISLADYLVGIEKRGALVMTDQNRVDPRLLETQHEKAVEATLTEQWDALGGEGSARIVLQTASLLGEAAQVARATLSLLTGLGDEPDSGLEAPLEEALQELSGLSLVEKLTERELRLHPLVRVFAEAMIGDKQGFKAECGRRLADALWDMGRLHEEVARRGVYAVLGDLRVGSTLAGAAERRRLRALMRPLDREAHLLRGWDAAKEPGFFLQQLRNQCFELGIEEVRERAEAKLEERGCRWLRERIRTSRASEALVRTLVGHGRNVNGVAVTADGRAVSASDDKTLKVWDLDTGKALRTLEGHSSNVNCVAVTADGRLAVSASKDKTLKVWDLDTGQVRHTLKGHTEEVNGVAVTADGRAVSASDDKTLKVWNLDTGQVLRTLEGHTRAVKRVAVTEDGLAVSASHDKTLKVWDLDTGRARYTLEGHTSLVLSVAVTADGRRAVSASWDKTLKVWDLATGQARHTREEPTDWVFGVAVTAEGRVVSASGDGTLKVWDLDTGEVHRTLEGHTSRVQGVAVTADGRAVSASWDNTLKVWDLDTEQAGRTLEGHSSDVNGVAVTGDGRAVSASDDKTLKVWNLDTGQVLHTLEGHTRAVNGVAVTADGRAVSASDDRTLMVWDLDTGQVLHTLERHTCGQSHVAVTADGHAVSASASASWNKTLTVWDLATGQALRTLEGHTWDVSNVAVTADGRLAVSYGRILEVWDPRMGQPLATLAPHVPLSCCAITCDGKTILAGDRVGALHILDRRPSLDDLGRHSALGEVQGGVGQLAPALVPVQAAVDLYRKVADKRPEGFLPYLASSLCNLRHMQSALRQDQAALVSIQEALVIYRKLAADRPGYFLLELAESLDILGLVQSALGQHEAALVSAHEALDLQRKVFAWGRPGPR